MSPAPAAQAPPLDSQLIESWGVSDDLRALLREKREAVQHFRVPVSQTPISEVFASLAATWKEDTVFASSVEEMVLHPAYQHIIALGARALPLILHDLQESGGHWFWALYALTGVTPFPQEAYGQVKLMTSAWLDWGRKQGILF